MGLHHTPAEAAARAEVSRWLAGNLPEAWPEGRTRGPEEQGARFAFRRAWQRRWIDAGWCGPS